tara:strand:+ start:8750 stop:9799 length:1050 start_codon:yes stop_codon:yes gene_type:complete
MLSICNKITGTERYLTWTGSTWSWQPTVQNYLFGCPHPRSIEPLLKIHGHDVQPLIEKKYLVMATELGLKNANFVGLIGPKFKKRLQEYTMSACTLLGPILDHRYTQFYFDTNDWLWTLQPTPLDYTRYCALKKIGAPIKFKTNGKHIQSVRYVRSKIKTGRLSVIQGPQVMTMKAEYRNVAKNCRQIDYSSMEPRFLLNVSGIHVDGDLYDWVAKEAGLSGDRTYTKIAIISSLYGSAKQIPAVTELFGLQEWEKQLEANVIDGVIENYYGRPIRTEGAKGRHLLSLWLQSSSADAAIKGFADFFRNNENLKPHWVIHDACVFSGEGNVPNEIIIDKMRFPITCEDVL